LRQADCIWLTVHDQTFVIHIAGFGSGLVPAKCGFTLHNRGANFVLRPDHPNCVAGSKRPYHTIIPGMATLNGRLWAPFSVMGGFMQPQGHVQVLTNMIDFGLDAQTALDAPRFCIDGFDRAGDSGHGDQLALEQGISDTVVHELKQMGHQSIKQIHGSARRLFGRGQIIRVLHSDENSDSPSRVLWAGSGAFAFDFSFSLFICLIKFFIALAHQMDAVMAVRFLKFEVRNVFAWSVQNICINKFKSNTNKSQLNSKSIQFFRRRV
jgi:hypothetical protein